MRSAPPGEAVEHRDDAGDRVPGRADRVDRLQRRAAGGDDVLDDEAALVGVEQRALDAALQPVLLGVLADEEGLDVGAAGQGGARGGIGAHRQPAHGGGLPFARQRGHQLGEGGEARGAQDGALGIDVVLRDLTAGEHDLSHDEGVAAQLVDQPLSSPHATRTLSGVLEGLLRTVSTVTGAIVLLSFALLVIVHGSGRSCLARHARGRS